MQLTCAPPTLPPPQDEDSETPDETAQSDFLKDDVEAMLSGLCDRDAGILRMRYGLVGGREHTLEEIGAEFEVRGRTSRRPSPAFCLLAFVALWLRCC